MGSAQPNVNAEKLKTLIVPYGPDEVIKEVVHFFKTGNSQIEDLNERVQQGQAVQKSNFQLNDLFSEQLSLVTSLRQAILTEAIQGHLTAQWRKENPNQEHARELLQRIAAEKAQLSKEKKISKEKPLPGIEEEEVPYEVPEGWVWCRFQEIASIASNLVSPNEFLELPHIAPDNIEKGTGKLLEFRTVKEDSLISSKHHFFQGQILYSKIRPHLNKLVEIDFEGLCSADMYPISSYIYRSYLANFMLSKNFVSQSTLTEGRVAMPKINQNELNKIIISVPPILEQHAIVQKVNALMAYCDELEQQVKQSKTDLDLLMQSVLGELFGTENQAVGTKAVKTKLSGKETLMPNDTIQPIYEGNTLNMEFLEILQQQGGKIAAVNLWKMSKYQKDIDAFYEALKKEVEQNKTIKESSEKGWLELVAP